MKILVLGENGFLGSYFRKLMGLSGVRIVPERKIHQRIHDIKDFETLSKSFPETDVIVNCIALTNINKCELEPLNAEWTNAILPGLISNYCVENDIKLIHISTDAVFDGSSPFATEETATNPLSVYGQTKLQGEKNVLRGNKSAIIVRTNFFGCSPKGDSFAEQILLAKDLEKSLIGYTDIYFTPTHARNVITASLKLAENNHEGIFHIVGSERISKYDFAMRLSDKLGIATHFISKGLSTNDMAYSIRSKDLSLSNTKLTELGLKLYSLEEDLEFMVKEFIGREK